MIVQDIYLPEFRWHCRVFYSVSTYWVDDILKELRKIGCSSATYRRAEGNLKAGRLNTGLTYSNKRTGESVMVIAKTSSADEFAHSYDHEKGHLAKHIALAYDIDPYGEEFQYMAGDIAKKMFPVAKMFLCDCCRKKLLRGGR
jgi:hypothetical protein